MTIKGALRRLRAKTTEPPAPDDPAPAPEPDRTWPIRPRPKTPDIPWRSPLRPREGGAQ